MIGEAKFLKPIFQASVGVLNPEIQIEGKKEVLVQVQNHSDLPFELEPVGKEDGLLRYSGLDLPPRRIGLMRVSAPAGVRPSLKSMTLPFRVKNLLVAPDQGLPVDLNLKVNFVQSNGN